MLVIGLTGGIACGKSTVARTFEKLGATVIDADALSRALTAPGGAALPRLRAAFGDGVFLADGTLDRAALAALVFTDERKREKLESVLHPMIEQRMLDRLDICRASGVATVVLDVPLLFEAGLSSLADVVVCVYAPEQKQLARLRARDGLSDAQARARIASQWSTEDKARLSDHVLHADGTLEQTVESASALYRALTRGKEARA